MHLKAAKLQRLRHENANTENKQWPGLLLLFFSFSKFLKYFITKVVFWIPVSATWMKRKGSIGMTGGGELEWHHGGYLNNITLGLISQYSCSCLTDTGIMQVARSVVYI
ncbi:MAG: hypothetical protein LBF82_03065 [Lactobacillales bacterium]|nr:hypothetical protein [Lactobacillales bacterium]